MNNHVTIDKSTGDKKCSCFKRCGGCQLEMSYQAQLEWKQGKADRMLSKFCPVDEIIAMENPYNYRNKVQTVFKYNGHKQIMSGVFQSSSQTLVATDDCMLEDKHCTDVIQTIKKLMVSFKIAPFDEKSGRGLIRHILTRYAAGTGELMVCIVTISPIFPSKNNFVKALRKVHPEVTTVVQNICTNTMPLTLGDRQNILFGKGYIEDVLCGLRFRISPNSFYQVNSVQTEKLYNLAVSLANLGDDDRIIDAYCGTGTIGLICSSKVKSVVGTELNRSACRDAIINSKLNKINNVRFINCDAGDYMQELAEHNETIDAVIMDPPRAGSDEKFLNSLATLSPQRVVYVSCKIETLERDLKILKKLGYKAKKIQPVDMFPFTIGIETVVVLERK